MSTEEKFNEVKEPLLDLRIKGLLAAYQLRREELLRCVDNINRGIQVFLAGTFLLIAYAIYSEEYLLFLVIPVVMFVLFNFLLYFFQFIFINEERCIEIKGKVGELLKDDRILCLESKYGRLSKKWLESKTSHVYCTLIAMMVLTYGFFSALALYFSFKDDRLGPEITYVLVIFFVFLILISYSNGRKVSKLKVKCK